MRTYTYGALFEPGDEGGIVVTFPDVPEAVTGADDVTQAREMAGDALGLALLTYVRQGRGLPSADADASDLVPVTVDPEVAAKLAVMEAFRRADITKTDFGRLLHKSEREVRRILDPMHPTKLPALKAALAALGWRLVVGVVEPDEAKRAAA